ncbi:MAG TPA: hypothetical protein PKB08_16935 [Burkholderiaceae bacterium]|nr:hypothetical protein [Burkholderiaceae bacterium]HMN66693.1 hypothetical protein [Burkholderiaceae bacterium]
MGSINALRALAAAAVVLLLWGCGGGGGGGTTATVIADTATAYWNDEAIGRWAFVQTDNRPGAASGRVNLVTVGTKTTIDGKSVVEFNQSSSLVDGAEGVELRYFDGRAIYDFGAFDPSTGTPIGDSFVELPAPLLDGVPTTVLDQTGPFGDVDFDGRPDTLRLVIVTTLGAEASRVVPAGTFSNVVRARTVFTATITFSSLGTSVSANSTLTSWYAPGVGPIRREYVDPNGDLAFEELSGVSLAAVKAGIVPGFAALDALGAADSNPAGIPSIATDGSNVLVVSRSAGASSPSVAGAILAADGSTVWSGTVFAGGPETYLQLRTAAAFDGAAYQVFWARPSDGALVAQRVAPGGGLLGPAAGTDVVPGSSSVSLIDAASNGSGLLVAWQRYDGTRSAHVIEAAMVDRTGTVVSPIVDLDAVSGTGAEGLSVAWSGGRFLIARTSGGQVSYRSADGATGALLDSGWQPLPAGGTDNLGARVAAHPDGFAVGWLSRTSMQTQLLGRRIGADGSVLDAADFAIDPVYRDRTSFALASGTQEVVAAWTHDGYYPDTAQRAAASRAALASGVPAFGAVQSTWYTQPNPESWRLQYAAATAPAGWLAIAMLQNHDAAPDRVVATFVHPPAVR